MEKGGSKDKVQWVFETRSDQTAFNYERKLLPDMIDRIQDSVEPAVMAGMNLAVIPGDEMNFRIETPVDLERLKLFINA